MKRRLAVIIGVAALANGGCLKASLNCPTSGQVMASNNAPDVTQLAEGLLTTVVTLFGKSGPQVKPAAVAGAPAPSAGTVSWTTFPLLGAQSVSCGQVAPVGTQQ